MDHDMVYSTPSMCFRPSFCDGMQQMLTMRTLKGFLDWINNIKSWLG